MKRLALILLAVAILALPALAASHELVIERVKIHRCR